MILTDPAHILNHVADSLSSWQHHLQMMLCLVGLMQCSARVAAPGVAWLTDSLIIMMHQLQKFKKGLTAFDALRMHAYACKTQCTCSTTFQNKNDLPGMWMTAGRYSCVPVPSDIFIICRV